MSATLGDVTRFVTDLKRRTGKGTAVVSNAERPVPLHYYYVTTPIHETIEELLTTKQAPVYVVHFTQESAVERAQSLMSTNLCTREEKDQIADLIGGFRFSSGFGKTLSRLVRHGIGVHHAGMLPKYRRLVELLAQAGLLKVICGTDTLGVGINVPIRTVLFTGLSKYDGQRTRQLKAREFHQIAGRAGRAGYDTAGTVVAQAPEHEVENERRLAKAGDDAKKRSRVVRKKAPEGFVSWGKPSFEKLIAAEPEPLTSSFQVTHSMVLNVIGRPGNAFEAMRHLLTDNDEPPSRQRQHIRRAIAIYRALLAAGVVERLETPTRKGRIVRLTVDLQDNFALNQPLSPLALAAIDLLDRESSTYALDVVSVIEATLDNPRQVLSAQQHKARGEAVAQMKADGIEYEERMERLEEVTYPKPLEELLTAAYEIYRRGHPWVEDYEIAPKSVVRDMSEQAMGFGDAIGYYGLARSEGILLRYLAGAFRALRQTVPEEAKTDELRDLVEWLGELVRQTDSSLLDEWEELRNPTEKPVAAGDRRRAAAGDGQRPGVPGHGAQRDVPPGRARGAAPLARPRRARAGQRLGQRRPGPTRWPRTSRSTRRSRPAPTPAARPCCWSSRSRTAGWSGRSSTTRRATMTGASAPRSTCRPPTRPARPSYGSPPWTASSPTRGAAARLVSPSGWIDLAVPYGGSQGSPAPPDGAAGV